MQIPQVRIGPAQVTSPVDTVTALGLATHEKVQQHRQIWLVFGTAIANARNVFADDPSTGIGGTYIQATDALHWLLSANSALWLQQINCEGVVPAALKLIDYRRVFTTIERAAKASPNGRNWLMGSAQWAELEMLATAADDYFRRSASISVSV